ncbi:nitrogen regulation protein NR(I) [Verticiella sediminum]|uniref:DNA-binding transcriptional regulator NtrC n=1 Tax=Verticiella sediminum TaxID=1247510 RepID=A0A556AYF0_9BURK|nr:nitrogen regulation protein NR(I) [Verticiella sediminum]TSH97957.1 nitrogen regulation protein NR(I) [Verticiella sediminum]
MKPIWVVDDDRSIRWVLEKALERAALPCVSFANASDALAALEHQRPQVLVSDVRMPGLGGLELLRAVKSRYPEIPVIVMTAYSDLDSAVASFQGGAFDYLAKPFDVDAALALIRRAIGGSADAQQAAEPAADAGAVGGSAGPSSHGAFQPGMLGQAPAMQELFRAIGRLSASAATVLITGESGSGKELVARALHRHSPRADKPFVAINTAAIAGELLESELFGHERGAFTGAHARRAGRFEEADGGTLFLDEIGDMPAELQTRLLRVLGDGTFYRVGGASPIRVNVRVIAATHQPLEQRVRQGTFREDLFHRLNVIRLRLPPLRERAEDIPLLAAHFLTASARSLGVEPKRLSATASQALMRFPFPGNVRQLENICHWLTVMAPSQMIDVRDLPPELREFAAQASGAAPAAPGWASDSPTSAEAVLAQSRTADLAGDTLHGERTAISAPSAAVGASWLNSLQADAMSRLRAGETNIMHEMTRDFERVLIAAALHACGGRRVDAATRLGLGRNTITRKMRELGME